jgi:hypothetical protein
MSRLSWRSACRRNSPPADMAPVVVAQAVGQAIDSEKAVV